MRKIYNGCVVEGMFLKYTKMIKLVFHECLFERNKKERKSGVLVFYF